MYFAEVCVIVRKNKEELFSLETGMLFECDLDEAAYLELRTLLRGINVSLDDVDDILLDRSLNRVSESCHIRSQIHASDYPSRPACQRGRKSGLTSDIRAHIY